MAVLREEYGEDKFFEVFKTITADNGGEFEDIKSLEEWGYQIHFAHPYSSWKRAQNERHKRLFADMFLRESPLRIIPMNRLCGLLMK